MKNLIYLTIVSILLFSCSTEEPFYHGGTDVPQSASKDHHLMPHNNNNPYDRIGLQHRETLGHYLKNTGNAGQQGSVGAQAPFTDKNSLLGKGPTKAMLQSSKTTLDVYDPWQALEEMIANSGLTSAAQSSLIDFIDTVMLIRKEGYGALYDYIIGYEFLTMGHPSFTRYDKSTILTFTSLVRHGTYAHSMASTDTEGEPDDDWNNTIGNIIGYLEIALTENP